MCIREVHSRRFIIRARLAVGLIAGLLGAAVVQADEGARGPGRGGASGSLMDTGDELAEGAAEPSRRESPASAAAANAPAPTPSPLRLSKEERESLIAGLERRDEAIRRELELLTRGVPKSALDKVSARLADVEQQVADRRRRFDDEVVALYEQAKERKISLEELGDSYRQYRQELLRDQERLQTIHKSLQEQQQQLRNDMAEANNLAAVFADPADRQLRQTQLQNQRRALEDVKTALQRDDAAITPPALPDTPAAAGAAHQVDAIGGRAAAPAAPQQARTQTRFEQLMERLTNPSDDEEPEGGSQPDANTLEGRSRPGANTPAGRVAVPGPPRRLLAGQRRDRDAARAARDALHQSQASTLAARGERIAADEFPPFEVGTAFEMTIETRAKIQETQRHTSWDYSPVVTDFDTASITVNKRAIPLRKMRALLQGRDGVNALGRQVDQIIAAAKSASGAQAERRFADQVRLDYYRKAREVLAAMRAIADGSVTIYQQTSNRPRVRFDGSTPLQWERERTEPDFEDHIPVKDTFNIRAEAFRGNGCTPWPSAKHVGSVDLVQASPRTLNIVMRAEQTLSRLPFDRTARNREDRQMLERLPALARRFQQALDSIYSEWRAHTAAGYAGGFYVLHLNPTVFDGMPKHWTGTKTRSGGDPSQRNSSEIDKCSNLGRLGGTIASLGILKGTGESGSGVEPIYQLIGIDEILAGSGWEFAFRNSLKQIDADTAGVSVNRTRSGLVVRGPWRRGASGHARLIFSGDYFNWQWHHKYEFSWTIKPVSAARSALIGDE